MSAETDFRSALVSYAPLTALVGTRIAENGVPPGAPTPYVVFTTSHEPIGVLNGPALGATVTFTVECWATGALLADQVANTVLDALGASAVATLASATVLARASGFDGDLGLDATVLTIEWWT